MVFIRSTACDVQPKRRSVTMLESGGHPDTALTSAFVLWRVHGLRYIQKLSFSFRACRWNAKWAVEWLSLSQSVKWRPTYRLSFVSYRLLVGTARIVCPAGSVQRYHVRPSVRLSVPAWAYNNKPLLQHCRFAAVGPAGETYRSTAERPALSSSGGDCGQCHAVSRRRKWNTDLIIIRPSFLPQYVKLLGPQLDKLIC